MLAVLPDAKRVIQLGLPGYMLSLVMQSIVAGGKIEMRMDFVDQINKASSAVIKREAGADVVPIAKAIEADGYKILQAGAEDQLTTLIAAVCVLILQYKERGIEIEENAFLVAFAIAEEAFEDATLYGSKHRITLTAGRMEKEARRLGYFSHLALVG